MISTSTMVWKSRALLVAASLVLLVSRGLSSQEPPSEDLEPAPMTVVVPLLKGADAPFSGLLVPEVRFRQMLLAEATSEAFQEKLEVERKAYDELERTYYLALEEASRPKPWYQSPEINRWLGFGAGVLVTSLVAVGVVEVLRVTK